MFSTADTIAAIATPPGHGGIGVVRISGASARDVARSILSTGELEPRRATFTSVLLREEDAAAAARPIDQAIATFFPAPNSYTGEDVVEISAHGSPVVLQAIVRSALRCGARLAEPGEFTLRAFLNERIDLVQAEAVADLIEAVTPAQARAAFDQLEGTLTREIGRLDASLFDLAARLEASIDFPDEGYHFVNPGELRSALDAMSAEIGSLVSQGKRGRMIREGRQVVIAGSPNVGKSTLFNALLDAERAIVTSQPGTTRDLLSEYAEIAGARVRLVDTAGIRQSHDEVEREGVSRARSAATVADIVVLVLDGSRPLGAEDRELLETIATPRLVVVNKADLPQAWSPAAVGVDGALVISSLRADDVAAVRREIGQALGTRPAQEREVPAITNVRHLELLQLAGEAVDSARTACAEGGGRMPEEFLLADLQRARNALEEVTGRRTSEDLLRHIFSRFCIGK